MPAHVNQVQIQGAAMISRRGLIMTTVSAAAIGGIGYGLWPRLDGYQELLEQQRRLLSADPDLTELVRLSTLAANGHNTQPWVFQLRENGLSIHPDLTRRTAVVDPDDHHLYVSLGCAAENLVIAAAATGRSADVGIAGGAETSIDVAFESGPVNEGPLYQAIPQRQSTRSAYDGQPISSSDIGLLKAAAQEEGVSIQFFTEASDRDAILEMVIEGNSAQIDDPAFVAELRDWIRFSSGRAVATGDGLFSACSGNPVTPEWMGGFLFNAVFTKDAENDKYRDHIRSSAGIAVIIGDRVDPEHWIKVGRSFERFALQATALGIRSAHINQPIEVPALRRELAGWLGTPDVRPDLVVRFGRAPALPMSLRRRVEAVIV
ncbi:Acg family FMN-binding oxidoreductase [Yoonia sp. R2-816]|uniref:Acg family FMN-binding oxidoreductase n=1 Tax=Yoonia sp. R2-816 TaxID=3342638 RepID=UPI00372CEC1B